MSISLKRSMLGHWKLFGITAVIVIALASGAYAYWRINASPSPPLYVAAISPPLELRMELDKTEFQQGENISIRLFLKNIDSESVEIFFPHWSAWNGDTQRHVLNFIVKDVNDTTVYIQFRTFFPSVYSFVLEPGEQRIETLEWVQTYNQDPYSEKPFRPGTYKIVGQTMNYGIPGKNFSEVHRLETPSIAITIS